MVSIKALSTRKKKKTVRLVRKTKSGFAKIPIDKGFEHCADWMRTEDDRKLTAGIIKEYLPKIFPKKEDVKAILSKPEWNFYLYTNYAAAIHWMNMGLKFDAKYARYPGAIKDYYSKLLASVNDAVDDDIDLESDSDTVIKAKIKNNAKVIKLNPLKFLYNKVNATVLTELDLLEDEWIEGKKTTMDIYALFQKYELKGKAVPFVHDKLKKMLSEYSDAYDKSCEQAVEAYAHIKRPELKRRIDCINEMILDLGKIKSISKAEKKTRVPKAKTADKQIKRLKFLKENAEYKIKSINPVLIPSSGRLYTFNVKTRAVTMYISTSSTGLAVQGTTIKNFDVEESKTTRLRDPSKFLNIILNKTHGQISKEWNNLTTKSREANGRINKDTIILRVISA